MKLRIKNLDTIKHLSTNNNTNSINSSTSLNYSINDLKITSQLSTQINGDTAQAKVVNYILFIPLFIMLESLSKNRALFQRRSNTILNMKDASNFHTFNKRNVWISFIVVVRVVFILFSCKNWNKMFLIILIKKTFLYPSYLSEAWAIENSLMATRLKKLNFFWWKLIIL